LSSARRRAGHPTFPICGARLEFQLTKRVVGQAVVGFDGGADHLDDRLAERALPQLAGAIHQRRATREQEVSAGVRVVVPLFHEGIVHHLHAGRHDDRKRGIDLLTRANDLNAHPQANDGGVPHD